MDEHLLLACWCFSIIFVQNFFLRDLFVVNFLFITLVDWSVCYYFYLENNYYFFSNSSSLNSLRIYACDYSLCIHKFCIHDYFTYNCSTYPVAEFVFSCLFIIFAEHCFIYITNVILYLYDCGMSSNLYFFNDNAYICYSGLYVHKSTLSYHFITLINFICMGTEDSIVIIKLYFCLNTCRVMLILILQSFYVRDTSMYEVTLLQCVFNAFSFLLCLEIEGSICFMFKNVYVLASGVYLFSFLEQNCLTKYKYHYILVFIPRRGKKLIIFGISNSSLKYRQQLVQICLFNILKFSVHILLSQSIFSSYLQTLHLNKNIYLYIYTHKYIFIHIYLKFITIDKRHATYLRLYLQNCIHAQIVYSYVIQHVISKKLTLGLLNPGSLKNNHDEFYVALQRHDVDVLAINETWLSAGEEARAPAPAGYRLRHTPRPAACGRSRGGGVGFYLKRSCSARLLAHPVAPTVEQMWMSVNVNGYKLLIGTAYRPPWLNVDTFIDALTDSFTSFSKFDYCVLMGDFNINMLDPLEIKTKKLKDFLTYLNLTQHINEPTHLTDNSETLIDLIISNVQVFDVGVDHIRDLSRHAFISFKLNMKKEKPRPKWILYRPIKDMDINNYLTDVALFDYDELCSGNVNQMVEQFNSYLIGLYDVHAPLKLTCVKEYSYPWITHTIRKMMHLRDEAYARSRITKSESHRNYYKDLKRTVSTALYHEKRAYFQQHINTNINNPRVLFKNLRKNVANFKNNDIELPPHLLNPDLINSHFLTLPGNYDTSSSNLTYYEFNRFSSAIFSLEPVSEITVSKIIKSITTNAQGTDGITLDMVLLSLPYTLKTITGIVNKSIETSTFPELWKTAIVKPLPKNNNPKDYKDLRPISILPFMSKILEKAVCMQLTQYLETNNILPTKQSGFRKGRSTATSLLDVVDDILSSQDEGEGTILTLLDFTRAFDSLDISLLLSKLAYYGFDNKSVKWFSSYLEGRSQFVEVCKSDGSRSASTVASVDRGVPQGSILGPVLFLLYSSDIVNNIKNCKYHMYADDVQLYISFNPYDTSAAVNKLNEDLSRLVEWSKLNSLFLNPDKSKFLILGSKAQINSIISNNPKVYIADNCLEFISEARNLGLLMDGSLHFENYILHTIRSCFYRLTVLYKMRKYLSVELRVRLCDTLILSKLNYADTVYGQCLLKRSQKLIQRIQNACARFCFPVPRRSHISPFLNSNNLLNMDARRNLHFATLLFGIITTKQPSYLYNKLTFSTRHIRHAIRLICPSHRTAAFRGSFRYAATKCWNNLPPPIRNSKTIHSFKISLKKHLLFEQKL